LAQEKEQRLLPEGMKTARQILEPEPRDGGLFRGKDWIISDVVSRQADNF
jgi:hypothetical protein